MRLFIPVSVILAVLAGYPARAEEPAPSIHASDQLLVVARENALLKEQIRLLEAAPTISRDALGNKMRQRLMEVARETRVQRQTIEDFDSFVNWMAANLSGYSKYLEAGSMAAGFAKILPIPYAGQASVFTKFVSQGLLSLNRTSVAMAGFLCTSKEFLDKAEAIDAMKGDRLPEVLAAARYADERLLPEMAEVQAKLAATADISASSLSFLETLEHYIGNTDEYWSKTKALLKRGETDKKEKGFLAEATMNLRSRTSVFNQRMISYNESARKTVPLVKSLGAFEELLLEIDAKIPSPTLEQPVAGEGRTAGAT